MALVGRHNIAKMLSTTTGTGTLTLTAAAPGYNTFANAGVVNAEVVTYTIRDGAHSEVGRGTYTTSGLTLSRDTVLSSTNSGSKIECTGRQYVMVSLAAEDISPFAQFTGDPGTVTDTTDNQEFSLNFELVDHTGLASVAANAIVLTKKGWYVFWVSVNIASATATAFNGYVTVSFSGYYINKGFTTAMGIIDDTIFVGPFTYGATSDGATRGPVTISNHLGSTLDYYIVELTVFKIGNK
jgi:hypothetical protein